MLPVSKNKNRKKLSLSKTEQADDLGFVFTQKQVLGLFKKNPVPYSWEALTAEFEIESKDQARALTRQLKQMEQAGHILLNRKGQYCLVNQDDMVSGVVIGHADGFGFLKVDAGGDDLFLPPKEMNTLMNGDRIVASVGGVNRQGKKEARLVDVLERRTKTVVGRFVDDYGVYHIDPENKRLHHNIVVPKDLSLGAVDGQIVLAEIIQYPSKRRQAIGKIVEVMGDHMAPGMEITVAIKSYGLPHEWSQQVIEEAQLFSAEVPEEAKKDRVDLRDLPLVTIDGADARDFDDAVYCKPTPKGWKLYVAIADVSHYVQVGSAIDREAFERGNSVYFPEQVLPMLPEVLSNGLCSLNPQVDRLCMVCEMRIDQQGEVISGRFYEAVMHSHARLTYDEVGGILDGTDSKSIEKHAKITPHLKNLFDLYKVLRTARDARGALDFDRPEPRFIFDENRKIKAVEVIHRHDAHRLIEECMILANATTARHLLKHKMPCLLRTHEGPGVEKLENFRGFLSELGLGLGGGAEPSPKDYRDLVEKIEHRADAHVIQTVLLRSLSQAVYSPEEKGHFGLALEAYAHFTSPIRRYPDLLIHRALKHVISRKKASTFIYNAADMDRFGEQSSHCERQADEATRDVVAWLKCEFMSDKIGQEFAGIISSVTSFGLFIELEGIYIEGLVHVTGLGDDYYHFDSGKHRLVGERTKNTYRLGDKIQVKLVRVDLDDKKIDLSLAQQESTKKRQPSSYKKSKRKHKRTKN